MAAANRINQTIRTIGLLVVFIAVTAPANVISSALASPPKHTFFSELPWQQLEKPKSHGGFVSFAISPNGRIVAGGTGLATSTVQVGNRPKRTTHHGGEVLLWNIRSGKLMGVLGRHNKSVDWLKYSSDGKTLVSISSDNLLVQVWNATRGKLRKRFRLKEAFSHWTKPVLAEDGKSLASVQIKTIQIGGKKIDTQGELTVWDTYKGTPRWAIPESGVTTMAFSPDSRALVGYVESNTWYTRDNGDVRGRVENQRLVMWNGATGEQLWESKPYKRRIRQLAFLPQGQVLVSLDGDTLVRWDAKTGEKIGELAIEGNGFSDQLVISRDGRLACIAHFMGDMIQLWALEEEKLHLMITAKDSEKVWHVGISPDLRYMACQWQHRPVVMRLISKK